MRKFVQTTFYLTFGWVPLLEGSRANKKCKQLNDITIHVYVINQCENTSFEGACHTTHRKKIQYGANVESDDDDDDAMDFYIAYVYKATKLFYQSTTDKHFPCGII